MSGGGYGSPLGDTQSIQDLDKGQAAQRSGREHRPKDGSTHHLQRELAEHTPETERHVCVGLREPGRRQKGPRYLNFLSIMIASLEFYLKHSEKPLSMLSRWEALPDSWLLCMKGNHKRTRVKWKPVKRLFVGSMVRWAQLVAAEAGHAWIP